MSENNLSKPLFNNVLDFGAAKTIKEKTGIGKAVKVDGGEPISASTQKHIDDMLELNKPPKKSLVQKYTDKMSDLLGLE